MQVNSASTYRSSLRSAPTMHPRHLPGLFFFRATLSPGERITYIPTFGGFGPVSVDVEGGSQLIISHEHTIPHEQHPATTTVSHTNISMLDHEHLTLPSTPCFQLVSKVSSYATSRSPVDYILQALLSVIGQQNCIEHQRLGARSIRLIPVSTGWLQR
eukprot:sb/3473029/